MTAERAGFGVVHLRCHRATGRRDRGPQLGFCRGRHRSTMTWCRIRRRH